MKEMFGGTVVGVGKCGKRELFFSPKVFLGGKRKKKKKVARHSWVTFEMLCL